MKRFTRDGNEALETHLADICDKVREGIERIVPSARLEGLLLGGGYGRGEGGVLCTSEGQRPYNDLEFYVLIGGNTQLAERAYAKDLHALADQLSPLAGVEVEFKIVSRHTLSTAAPNMFFYDLISGHRQLLGPIDLLQGCAQHRDGARIPISEAARLLFNRCSGLLFSVEHLGRSTFGAKEADFVGRNLAKAQLCFGDVVLAASGRYHWSVLERQHRLKSLEFDGGAGWRQSILTHHAAGVAFKLHPFQSQDSRKTLLGLHGDVTEVARKLWLWLESRRLGKRFESTAQYALDVVNKCPETNPIKNLLINLRTFGLEAVFRGRGLRYPRERLFHSLCWLLFETRATPTVAILRQAQRELLSQDETFADLVNSYYRLWSRFN